MNEETSFENIQPTKWWLDSQTVQGILVAGLPTIITILTAFGVKIGDGEAQSIVQGIVGLIGLVGAVVAIAGRFKATEKLTAGKE